MRQGPHLAQTLEKAEEGQGDFMFRNFNFTTNFVWGPKDSGQQSSRQG